MGRPVGLLLLLALLGGCGGGAPLLHPAKTLGSGDVRAAGGISAHIAAGAIADDLRRAREIAAGDPSAPGAPGTSPDYAKGALVSAAIAPGLAPYVSARVGVGYQFEGGLTYTGRGIRADMRRSFGQGPWTVSVGVGGTATLYGRQQGSDLPNVELGALRGYGADLPVLIGWESAGGLYSIWFGPRGGFEHISVEAVTSEPKAVTLGASPVQLEATRGYGGGVVGLATGFNHVHVAIEAGLSYQLVTGSYNANDVTVHGFSITPATALWWSF